ncbi:MAG TPA: hypothetical protein VF281_00765 [Candidatus Saccharimonadales bacterium]
MLNARSYMFAILMGIALNTIRKLHLPHPFKYHRLRNQEIQHHDILTIRDEIQVIRHDWREIVPHRH